MARIRGFETVADMVRSMAVVMVVVIGLFLVVWFQRPEAQGPLNRVVDIPAAISSAELSASTDFQTPTGLPDAWRATTAFTEGPATGGNLDGVVLRIGYLTPLDSYAEVLQTDADRSAAVAEWLGDVTDDGSVEIGARTWQQVTVEETGRPALLGRWQGTTQIVTGKAGLAELQALAASLR